MIWKVTAERNIGKWLNDQYRSRDHMQNAIHRILMARDAPEERKPISLAPTQTMNDFWVTLDQLDYSKDAKHGSLSIQRKNQI